jgi:hypothetical protein
MTNGIPAFAGMLSVFKKAFIFKGAFLKNRQGFIRNPVRNALLLDSRFRGNALRIKKAFHSLTGSITEEAGIQESPFSGLIRNPVTGDD